MKKFLALILSMIHFVPILFCQANNYTKKPALGINFVLSSFNDHKKLDALNKGVALSYLKGLTNHIDISTSIGGSFLNYPISGKPSFSSNDLLIEAGVLINAKLLSDKYFFTPFLTSGILGSRYKDYYGVILPVGIGLQINFYDNAFLLINSQYRLKMTNSTNNHCFYSIGLAGNIGRKKIVKNNRQQAFAVDVIKNSYINDADLDGITDSLDLCPFVAGLTNFHGCPDTDMDGINDNEDKCPTIPGIIRYQGCPVTDTDKDGINDEEDQCIKVPGIARYNGCPVPDADNDGINDEKDNCPSISGLSEHKGCPLTEQALTERINFAATNIFFATGSYQILPISYKSLNDVVKILKDYPEINIEIQGHTDNAGTPHKNKILSQQRADAIKDFLANEKIDKSRLTSLGFGQDMPKETNSTTDGRAANRRVEIKLR